ncbi:hypothetical protein ACGFXC_05690 [Streptomyces sp. NPDC048507]|uniref:hypothetical protein n=1 Tax=Streptomyces sp. NPDC048507 TaxID=3365560 RepID=UPI00371CB13C
MRAFDDTEIEEFLGLSGRLTGFGPDELRTGGAPPAELLAALLERVGAGAYRRLAAEPDAPGPEPRATAEALIRLWYTGSLPELPGRGGTGPVSARAHAGGLVWRAVGVPAPGTSAPGFGSWSGPVGADAPGRRARR